MYVPVAYHLAGDLACPDCVRQGRRIGTVLRPPAQPGQRLTCARLDANGIPVDAMDTFGSPIRPVWDSHTCHATTCAVCGSTLNLSPIFEDNRLP